MTGSTYAPLVIAIVVSIALAGWLGAVFYANARPRHRPKRDIKTEVAGGAFRAEHGGRQLMPIPGERVHDIPAQRAATAADTYRVGDDLYSGGRRPADDMSDADAETRPLAGHGPR